jgi:hypothetical protein
MRHLLSLSLLLSPLFLSACQDEDGNPKECAAHCFLLMCASDEAGGCAAACEDAPSTDLETASCYEYIQLEVVPIAQPGLVLECSCISPRVSRQFPAECGQYEAAYGGADYLEAICLDE